MEIFSMIDQGQSVRVQSQADGILPNLGGLMLAQCGRDMAQWETAEMGAAD